MDIVFHPTSSRVPCGSIIDSHVRPFFGDFLEEVAEA